MTSVYADRAFKKLIQKILSSGSKIASRNGNCTRIFAYQEKFNETPLVSIRKTAWKSALREMEWFLSGSNSIKDLHPSVWSWWKPFCKIDPFTLPYNYGKILRRYYAPEKGRSIEVKPAVLVDGPTTVPTFPKLTTSVVKSKFAGYVGKNFHGDTFRVVEQRTDDTYLLQFDSNGYSCVSRPCNFVKGIVKNPYFMTVLGQGCVGVVDKGKYTYYKRAYQLWSGMMNRCYNKKRRHYKWYGEKGIKVAPRWRCFEYFLEDLPSVPGFEEWLLSAGEVHLDKDHRKANYYGPDVCVFLYGSHNVGLANAERFFTVPRKEVYIDQIQELLDGMREHPNSRRLCISTWDLGHVTSGLMSPTNCHGTVIQVFVEPEDNTANLVMYQRSVDVICGLPHNWIQYWAMLLWASHHTGRVPGSFTWIGGDVHIYDAHKELAEKILQADQYKGCPNLVYTPTSTDFKVDDFTLDGPYEPLLLDKAEMIV